MIEKQSHGRGRSFKDKVRKSILQVLASLQKEDQKKERLLFLRP